MNLKTNRLVVVLLFFTLISVQSQVKTIGLPEIRNYKRSDYKGGTQNWNIDQDKNDNLYFANNNGLLQFDGSVWTKYSLPNLSSIRSLKIGNYGKIYVGGYNEFGYFEANTKGKLIYTSLSNLIKKENTKIIDFIWKIYIHNEEVLFQSFEKAYVYKNGELKILDAPDRFQFSFQVNNKLYFQDKSHGLLEYTGGLLIPLAGTTIFNTTEIWGMFPMPNNKILIATLDKGLFVYDKNSVIPWESQANEFIKKNSSLGGAMLKDKNIVLNSVLDGLIVCDLNGVIIQHISRKNGLQNNTVLSSFVDSKNNLWLGLDNGIAFINENSPFTYFGLSFDLSTVYSSVVFENNLYVATNQGVFYHSWNNAIKDDIFQLVEGTTGQAWNIQLIDGLLLCSHNKGALVIKGGKSTKTFDETGYWGFKKIPNHPNYIIGSNYKGFALFEKTLDGLVFKHQMEGFTNSAGNFEIDEKYIWFIKDNLVYKLKFSNDYLQFEATNTYRFLSKKEKGIGSIQKIENKVSFQTNNHFYNYNEEQDYFDEDNKTTKLFKKIAFVQSITEDSKGNIWYVFNESLGVLIKNGPYAYTNKTDVFSSLKGNLVYNYLSINTINPENIFIGLTDGLVHYDSKLLTKFKSKPKVFIRNFSYPEDTILFGNSYKIPEVYTIPFKSNQVKFRFSSPTYENVENVYYSYQLEGFDDSWSNWSTSNTKEYTNLKEGDYKMNVKARNSYGIQSENSTIAFSISPPWYRHFLAYIFYLIACASLILLIRKNIQMKIRKNKYYETIEQRRIYLERESKTKQAQLELENEIERLKSDTLQIKITTKDKELVNNTLQIVKKNKTLNGIINKLKDINLDALDESTKIQFTKLNRSIIKEVNTDKSWHELEKHLKNVHFEFLKRLKEKFPTISPRELDLSTYLLMNMSTKEIAEIMNISGAGVELARYRLRKKLGLTKKENLIGFLMSI